ncbi:MAG: 3-deoxy-D-manno-octulosonic acid transferase [Bacteroidales bacterium]|nr:3-deoxy-D-manno-octulosonic acid transferase [Bacteroidales bacterium]MCB9000165.1 3-deoxy-D-manno-octulosonic acid transferase [Bacteroidales bacterium]MCB9012710.1 3-deoxy-D-manno-octulosonic acid transferase [Bacteroidales bacterium]
MLYKIGIQLYFFLIILLAPFNVKARRWLKGRRGIWKKIRLNIKPGDKVVWVHCASLGEFEQGRPIIEEIKKTMPEKKILLTFFSPSGYELRKNYEGADCVTYMPLDTRFNAWLFMNLVKPEMAFFIKYDYWYYFLRTLKKKHIPAYLVSGKFRREQVFFKWYGSWYRSVLKFFNILYVQNEESRRLLAVIGIKNVEVTGDTRFDRVFAISRRSVEYPWLEPFARGKKVIVAGSTWEKDEQLLIEFINYSGPEIRFILAPHEISERKLIRIIELIEHPCVRFTDNDKSSYVNAKVLIVDTIGNLSSLYRYGQIAYIGGGFGKGIHNILEAATYGLPVVFGPRYGKFLEAVEMIERKAAFSITNYEGLKDILEKLCDDELLLAEKSKLAKTYIESKLGATQSIVNAAFSSTIVR